MQVTFVNPGIDYMIERIMDFQREDAGAFWSEPLFHFYPQLDKSDAQALSFPERKRYIEGVLRNVYTEIRAVIDEKTGLYAAHWEKCRPQITCALSDAFDTDCNLLFNDLRCHVSMNPIEPRFLKERQYDIFYLNSERGAIGESIHEIIHFVWFHIWQALYQDAYEEYERPSLKWILSEMAVEPIMRDPRLSAINPYFPRENGGCVYPYFYDMVIGGRPILETLHDMHQRENIRDFMACAYDYCRIHEAAIRRHIQAAEAGR